MTRIAFDGKYEVSIADGEAAADLFSERTFVQYQSLVQKKTAINFVLMVLPSRKLLISQTFSSSSTSAEWISPITGAFGAMTSSEYVTMSEIEFFITSVSKFIFSSLGGEKISWRLPPLYYRNKVHTKLQNVLYRLGWNVEDYDLNFHLPIVDYESFRSNLSSSKRRELNRVTKTAAEFSVAATYDQRKAVYDIIKRNRDSQGYPMTMSWDSVLSLANAIDDKARFYMLERDGEILAGAICLVVDPETLYVFYWGENPEFRNDSVIVKLAEGIYLEALRSKFLILDIGTSTNVSIPNQGLISFKENIGCLVSQKLTYVYYGR